VSVRKSVSVRVCERVSVCVRVCVRAHARVRACVCVCVCVDSTDSAQVLVAVTCERANIFSRFKKGMASLGNWNIY